MLRLVVIGEVGIEVVDSVDVVDIVDVVDVVDNGDIVRWVLQC